MTTHDAIEHIPGRAFDFTRNPFFEELVHLAGEHHLRLEPAFVDKVRDLADKFVTVRQLPPTSFISSQISVGTVVPVQIAFARRERMSVVLVNTGSNTVYIGPTQATAQPANGFPLLGGSALTLSALSDIWGSVASGSAACTVGVLDEYKGEANTDNVM